jgi:hypothetical protein
MTNLTTLQAMLVSDCLLSTQLPGINEDWVPSLSVTNCQHFSNQSNCLIVADLSERVSVFVFPTVIVPATRVLSGCLNQKFDLMTMST